MEVDEFEDLLSWFLDALENATLRSIIKKLREANTTDLEKLDELFSRMEIRTAVALLRIIESNLGAIDALEKMHHENAKERGVIAKHLEKNPWLIHTTWLLHKAEGRVTMWIREKFGLPEDDDKENLDRADFFCIAVGGTIHIVEIKRGKYEAKAKDFLQADKYRTYVEKRFKELGDHEAIKYERVQSHLIAAEMHQDAQGIKNAYQDKGWVIFTTWDDLIERAKYSHHQYRDELQKINKGEDIGAE